MKYTVGYFTCESLELSLSMLDMMIVKDPSGKLYTTLYTKPTDTHSYLHYALCHPHHPNTWGPYSQLLRVCTKDYDFETHSQNIITFYKSRNYPEQLLQEHFDKVKLIPRTALFTINEESETPGESPLVCVSTYHPLNPPVKDILNKNWSTLLIDTKLQCVSDKRVVFGHNRLKNLCDILANSKISYPPKDKSTLSPQVINPTKICNNAKCRYCPKLDLSGMIRSTTTGRIYIRPQRITCKFNNLIYLITCRICRSRYVGQTGKSIQMRFQKHAGCLDTLQGILRCKCTFKYLLARNFKLLLAKRHDMFGNSEQQDCLRGISSYM